MNFSLGALRVKLNFLCNALKSKLNWYICASTTNIVENFSILKRVSMKSFHCKLFYFDWSPGDNINKFIGVCLKV